MVAAILLACGVWTLVRTGGVTGDVRFGVPLAVDADSRGTAPGPGRDEPTPLPPAPAPADGSSGDRRGPPWPGDAAAGSSSRPLQQPPASAAGRSGRDRDGEPNGRAFADPSATASFAACGSRPTGRSRRRSRCGAGRSDRAGRPSRSTATSSTPRSSAVTTRSSPATGCPPASRCGDTATRSGSGSRMAAPVRARRRPSATVASTRSVRPES